MTKMVKTLVEEIITNKPGGDTISLRKLGTWLEKNGYYAEDVINDSDLSETRELFANKIHELLIEKNISDRQKMGELTLEDLYPMVRQTTTYHYKSLDEYDIDPEDIVQNVMIKAYNNWDSFRGECQLATWVFRIVKNEVINMLIFHNRMKRKATGIVSVEDPDFEVEDGEGTFEDQLVREENVKRALELISQIPSEQDRNIVEMLLKGNDYKTIANTLKVSYANVRVAVHHARQLRLDDGEEM